MLLKVTFHRILLGISRCITNELGARNTPEYDITGRFKLVTPKHGIWRLYLTGS